MSTISGQPQSSIQVTPYIAEHAERVLAYTRTPAYVLPRPDEHYGEVEKQRFRDKPELLMELRSAQYDAWNASPSGGAQMDEEHVSGREAAWRAYFDSQVKDPYLRDILTPRYRFGCKRPLSSNRYYAAVVEPNVQVISGGVADLAEQAVVGDDGRSLDADVVVLATGFQVTGMLGHIDVCGEGGQRLADVWKHGPEAYLGTLVKHFPKP